MTAAGGMMPTGGDKSAPGDPSAHQLRLFLLLAEELHFGRAARRAFMTQPAFSQQIRALERRLGLTLADRTTHTTGLTTAGHRVLPEIHATVNALDRLRHAVGDQIRKLSGRFVIGTLEATTSVPPIPAILEELKHRHPHIDVNFHRLAFADCADQVLNGAVDAAFLFPPVPPGIQTHQLATMPRVVCLADTDVLAQQGPLTLAQLSDRPFIGWSPKIPKAWRDFWSADPRPDGTPVTYTTHKVAEFEAALTAIALGEGIEFAPEPSRWLHQRHGVTYVEVTDLPPCTTALAWRAQDRDRPLIQALRQTAQNVARGALRKGG